MNLYVAGPITHTDREKSFQFYLDIEKVAKSLGYGVFVPHRDTHPPDIEPTHKQIYTTDKWAVENADVVIAYVGETSLGVGMELEVASHTKTKIILLSEHDVPVSSMVLGSPNIHEHICFSDHPDALQKLKPILEKIYSYVPRTAQPAS